MGMGTPEELTLRITFSFFLLSFFFIRFFYCRKMNLAISLGLILSAVVVTARIVKPGGETNNDADIAAAIPEEGDEEIVQTAVAEKKEIKPEMAEKVKALRVSSLRNESKDAVTAKLAELRQELATLKVAKVTAQSASKLGKINVVRKDIAKVLTVINQTRKAELQKLYRGKSVKPVDLKPRKTRALRKRLNKHEESLKSLKTVRRQQKTALKNFALKA